MLFAVIAALLAITEGQLLRLDPPAPGEFLRRQVTLLDHVQYLPFGFPKPCCGLFECQLHDNMWYVFNRLCLIDDKGVTKNFCASRKINPKKQGVKGSRLAARAADTAKADEDVPETGLEPDPVRRPQVPRADEPRGAPAQHAILATSTGYRI